MIKKLVVAKGSGFFGTRQSARLATKEGQKSPTNNSMTSSKVNCHGAQSLMSCFFWNIHCCNKRIKHGVVNDWEQRTSFDFGCIIETKVKERKQTKF